MDHQNFVSIFHDKVGLIVGGGNTKLQPEWSNFTAGDAAGFFNKVGDENPNFLPPPGLTYLPTEATLLPGSAFGVELRYGEYRASIRVDIKDETHAAIVLEGDHALTAHVTLLPKTGATIRSSTGKYAQLMDVPWMWTPNQTGKSFDYRAIDWQVPQRDTSLRWPVLPFNPYRKDGHSLPEEGRLVLDIPMTSNPHTLTIQIEPTSEEKK
jgi:hypothetical protein